MTRARSHAAHPPPIARHEQACRSGSWLPRAGRASTTAGRPRTPGRATVDLAPSRRRSSGSSPCGSSTTSTRSRSRPTRSRSSRSTMLAALAMATERVRLGHMVVCTGFRNPALTAKMSSTIDVISGGRFELGIGAGWKEDEWRAYGYGFPPLAERLAVLGDHLEIITAMLGAGTRQLRGTVRARPRRDQRAQGDPAAADPDHRRGQRPERDVPATRSASPTSSTSSSSTPPRSRSAWSMVRAALRGGGPRPGDAPVLALLPGRATSATVGQERVDRLAAFAALGLDRIVASRPAGTRPSTGSRGSPRTAAWPDFRSPGERPSPQVDGIRWSRAPRPQRIRPVLPGGA